MLTKNLIPFLFAIGIFFGCHELANQPQTEATDNSITGTAVMVIVDHFKESGTDHETRWFLHTEGKQFELVDFRHESPEKSMQSGDRITVSRAQLEYTSLGTSKLRNGQISIDGHSVATHSLTDAEASSTSSSTGEQRVAVILVNSAQDPIEPYTVQDVEDTMFNNPYSAAEFFRSTSFGKTWLTGDVFGWYTLPTPIACQSLNFGPIFSLADADIEFVAADGTQNYDRIMVIYGITGCAAGGQAELSPVFLRTEDGEMIVYRSVMNNIIASKSLAHEQGHNYGVLHANRYDCPNQDYQSSQCVSHEYGNRYETMSSGSGHFNAQMKEFMGWFDSGNIVDITNEDSDLYTLHALGEKTDKLQVLRIPRNNKQDYYIEYRSLINIDSESGMPESGLHINFDGCFDGRFGHPKGNCSYILRDEEGPDDFYEPDSSLIVSIGEEFFEPYLGMRITPQSETSDSMTLQVDFEPVPNLLIVSDQDGVSALVGSSVIIPYQTSNASGAEFTTSFTEKIYVKNPYEDWELIDSRILSGMGAQQSIEGSITVNHDGKFCGQHRLKIVTDVEKSVPESNEGDNVWPGDQGLIVNIECPFDVDLVARSKTKSARLPVGRTWHREYLVSNLRREAFPMSFTNTLTSIGPMGSTAQNILLTNMSGAKETAVKVEMRLEECGVRRLKFVVDSNLDVMETAEDNNVLTEKVWNEYTPSCAVQPLVADEHDNRMARIDGTRTAWLEQQMNQNTIVVYDFATGEEWRIPLSGADWLANIELSKDLLIWNTTDTVTFEMGVAGYNLRSNTLLPDIGQSFEEVSIAKLSNDRIVWEDKRNDPTGGNTDLYMFDLATREETKIVSTPGRHISPDIHGDRVVWVDYRNMTSEVYVYDIHLKTEKKLTSNPGGLQFISPTVSRDYAAWYSADNSTVERSMYVYSFATGETSKIAEIEGYQPLEPKLDGSYVAWIQGGTNKVNVYDLKQEKHILIDDSPLFKLGLEISYGKVVWEDYRNIDSDIYIATIPAVASSGSAN